MKYYDFTQEKILHLLRLVPKLPGLESDYVFLDPVAKNVLDIGYIAPTKKSAE